ncbi:exonuclease, partial [Escherichia coli EC1856]
PALPMVYAVTATALS